MKQVEQHSPLVHHSRLSVMTSVDDSGLPLQGASTQPARPDNLVRETRILIPVSSEEPAKTQKPVTRADLAALDVDPSKPRSWASKVQGKRTVGRHKLWRRGVLDHARHFLLSQSFQQGAQVAMGEQQVRD